MVNFIQAADTINDPETGYIILNEDDDKYIFAYRSRINPIEAGSFFSYVDPSQNDMPDFAVDDICFNIQEYRQNRFVMYCPKLYFELGSIYTQVSDLSTITLDDNFVKINAQGNSMTYYNTGEELYDKTCFKSTNNYLALQSGYQTKPPLYFMERTSTSFQTFKLYFSQNIFATIEYAAIIQFFHFSSFVESNQ